ncbi:MAG: Holliday junction resolvase-like protein [Solirubrobacterales bacterium]
MEALAAALLLALLLVVVKYIAYRSTHPHTAADLEAARKESVRISRATRGGKAYENLVPFLPEFEERFDREDARFLGAPIDLIVFDGLSDPERGLREIVFVEIKSGRPTLSPREKAVREVVEDGRVRWERIVLGR